MAEISYGYERQWEAYLTLAVTVELEGDIAVQWGDGRHALQPPVLPANQSVVKAQGADLHPPPPLYAKEGRQKSYERGNHPTPPQWDRRAIQPNQINFMTCTALAPM